MIEIKVFLLMVLAHIIDDFVLQPICLSKLKQISWWEKEVGGENELNHSIYKKDYEIGLITHSLSWAIMIHLPLIMFGFISNPLFLVSFVIINATIHMIVDNLKANVKVINLRQDQAIHYIQIIITFILCLLFN